jgi:hypothetical protein
MRHVRSARRTRFAAFRPPLALALCAALLAPAQAAADAPSGADATRASTEPAACRAPFSAVATEAAPETLAALASRCREPAVATLFRNRAEHAEQLRRLAVMSRLLRQGANTDQVRLTQCRVYAGLAEAFAERLQRADPSALPRALAQLNLAYEQAIHIAERTIQGHERIVGLPAGPR